MQAGWDGVRRGGLVGFLSAQAFTPDTSAALYGQAMSASESAIGCRYQRSTRDRKMTKYRIFGTAFVCIISFASHAETIESEADALATAKTANQAKDYATSTAIYRRLADQDSAAAPAMLGLMYFAGRGVPRDHTRACDFYAVAEQRGDPSGTELLADCFFKGEGRAQDYAQSALLYERASTRGVAIADCALGNQYLRGLGVPKDPTKAAALCRKSADRGVADAQTDLGQLYLVGEGVEKNLAEAAAWFQKAVDQGQANAAMNLGTMYWNGDGVPRDHVQAAKVWHISAEHGNTSAPSRLAKYYLTASLAADKRIIVDPAVKAAYWGTIATRVDPDPAARGDSEKLVDLLMNAAPSLKPNVESMLAAPTPPSF